MNDEILKRLEAKLDRRSFLRGPGLGAAALLGVAAASPLVVFAQEPQQRAQNDKKTSDEQSQSTLSRVEGRDGKFYDREGVEVRECPEGGYNMYRQGRTWTCENCGYSYIE